MRRTAIFIAFLATAALPAAAQQSPSFKLSDAVFNAGGHPSNGTVLTSASFKISLDSIGEGIASTDFGSASFAMDAGLGACYPPAGEVADLRFADATTLAWDPEKSIGAYNLYRDLLSSLVGGGYGSCLQQELPDETTTDTEPVPLDDGFFYLATAVNRLGEEGTKGNDSGGAARAGGVCP